MPIDETLGCAVCGASMQHVGVLYKGTRVVRILACENGHFIQTIAPDELKSWLDLAEIHHLSTKVQESDVLPSTVQELWVRQTDTWAKTKLNLDADAAVVPTDVNACPFCHSGRNIIMRDSGKYFLCCDACGVYGPEAADLADAVAKWNAV